MYLAVCVSSGVYVVVYICNNKVNVKNNYNVKNNKIKKQFSQ